MGFNIASATVLGYICGIFNSYYFGRNWVFKNNCGINEKRPLHLPQIFRFWFVYAIGGAGMALISAGLVHWYGVDYRLSWFFGAVFAFVNNYWGSKYVVFK